MTDPEHRIFQLSELDDAPIERTQEDDTTVRYSNIKLLAPGVWTDSGSQETVWYSPRGLSNLKVRDDNTLNIMHDVDNEASAAGHIDPESVQSEEDGIYADLVIDTSNAAGEYADENLQATLESEGAKGFGGPSVEIPPEGQEIEFNESKGLPELTAGYVSGAALVKNPASKSASFARQTAQRAVALSDSQTVKGVYQLSSDMSNELDLEALREKYNLGDDIDEETVVALAEAGALDLESDEDDEEEEEEEEESEESEEEDEEPPEEEDGDDEEPEEEEIGMEDKVASIEERLSNVEDMMEQAMAAEELSEELEEATQDLADAESVQELSDAKEELDKRLSALEEEPEEPKTLADGSSQDDEDWFDADPDVNYSDNSL